MRHGNKAIGSRKMPRLALEISICADGAIMTENGTEPLQASIMPNGACFICPNCGHCIELDIALEEDIDRSFVVPAADRFMHCPHCEAFLDCGNDRIGNISSLRTELDQATGVITDRNKEIADLLHDVDFAKQETVS